MSKKYDLKKMLEEIQEDINETKSASIHLTQDEIKKLVEKKKKNNSDKRNLDGDQNKE